MPIAATGSPETYRRLRTHVRTRTLPDKHLDAAVDEQGDFIAIQHDDVAFWIKKEAALRPRDAINYSMEVLDKTPTDERALACRAWAYMAINELDRSLKDHEELLRMNPQSVAWKNNRGECYIKRKEYDKAIVDFTDMLNANPNYFFALYNRSEAYIRTRQFVKALSDVQACLLNEAKVPALHMNLARVLATAPRRQAARRQEGWLRAAKKAVEMIKYRDGRFLDTLAAAYAEAGDFDKAVETQQKQSTTRTS